MKLLFDLISLCTCISIHQSNCDSKDENRLYDKSGINLYLQLYLVSSKLCFFVAQIELFFICPIDWQIVFFNCARWHLQKTHWPSLWSESIETWILCWQSLKLIDSIVSGAHPAKDLHVFVEQFMLIFLALACSSFKMQIHSNNWK